MLHSKNVGSRVTVRVTVRVPVMCFNHKGRKRGEKGTIKVTCVFSLAKILTKKNVFSYRCKASRTMSERSRVVDATNRPCMPRILIQFARAGVHQQTRSPQLYQPT